MTSWLAAIRWRWVGLGVGAYIIFLLATLPAALIAKRLQSQGIVADGIGGSVWNGHAAALQIRGMSVGEVHWRIHPTGLLLGRLNADIKIKRDDGFAETYFSMRRNGDIAFTDLRATLPIPVLNSFANRSGAGMNGMLGGWRGLLRLQLSELAIERSWPTQIVGNVDAQELVGPARQPTAIGSYRIEFASAKGGAELQGSIASQPDAPLDVVGVIRLQPNRQYVIDAQVGTRANAPASIGKALEYLGPADAQGRRPLSLAGSL